MRMRAALLFIAVSGCTGDPVDSTQDAGLPIDSGAPGPTILRIDTGTTSIAAQTTRTDCYYTTLDVDAASGVGRWSSTMSVGVYQLIVHLVDTAPQPDGTRVEGCSPLGPGIRWAHFAQTPSAQTLMPTGVGIPIVARQPVVIEMRLYNPSDSAIEAGATVEAELVAPGTAFEPAAAFVAFALNFSIPAATTNYAVERSCDAPTGAFFALTTSTHRFSVATEVRDGTEVVFSSNNWESPGEADWRAPPHHTFAGALAFQCVYQNDTSATVFMGDSPQSDEMCMVVAWRFPASEMGLCMR